MRENESPLLHLRCGLREPSRCRGAQARPGDKHSDVLATLCCGELEGALRRPSDLLAGGRNRGASGGHSLGAGIPLVGEGRRRRTGPGPLGGGEGLANRRSALNRGLDRSDGTLGDHDRHAAPGRTPAGRRVGSRDGSEAVAASKHISASGRRVPQEGDRGKGIKGEGKVANARDRARDRYGREAVAGIPTGSNSATKCTVADARDRVSNRQGCEVVVKERSIADARDRVRDRHGGEAVVIERRLADARDRTPDRHTGEGVGTKRTGADARDRVRDRHGGEGVVVKRQSGDARDGAGNRHGGEVVTRERVLAEGRDGVAIKGGRDDEGCWAGTGAASDGGNAARDGVFKATSGKGPRTAGCSEAHGEQEGKCRCQKSLERHQVLHFPIPYPRAAGAYLHDPLAGGVLGRCYTRRGLP